jgi:hypothetical protein
MPSPVVEDVGGHGSAIDPLEILGLALGSYHCYGIRAYSTYGNSSRTGWACATTPHLELGRLPVVQSLWLSSTEVRTGQSITARFRVRNVGGNRWRCRNSLLARGEATAGQDNGQTSPMCATSRCNPARSTPTNRGGLSPTQGLLRGACCEDKRELEWD